MYVFHFLLCSLPSFIHWLILVTTKNTIFLFIFKGLLIFITHVLMNNKVREKKTIFIGLKIDDVKLSTDFCV